jgi:hypothetical protein
MKFSLHRLISFLSLFCQISNSEDSAYFYFYSESESELLYDWRFTANQFILASRPLRPTPSIFFNWTLTVIALMKHPLSREDRSVVYNCCWPRQRSHSRVRVPRDCFRFEIPPTWWFRPPYLYPSETEWLSYTPRQWVPFLWPPTTLREVFEPVSIWG